MILHETVSTLNNCEDFWFQYHLVSFCKQLLLMVKNYFAIGIDNLLMHWWISIRGKRIWIIWALTSLGSLSNLLKERFSFPCIVLGLGSWCSFKCSVDQIIWFRKLIMTIHGRWRWRWRIHGRWFDYHPLIPMNELRVKLCWF